MNYNFKNVNCQLGGLRLNGIVNYNDPSITSGTAESLNVLTIDDPAVVQPVCVVNDPCTPKGFFQVTVGSSDPCVKDQVFFIPLFQ